MKYLYEGTISCKAILENKNRNCRCLYVDSKKRTRDFRYIIQLAKKRNVKVQICNRSELDALCDGTKHGGMLLEADLCTKRKLENISSGFNVYVDGIEDPYNLGSICRTLYASGAKSLILPLRDLSFADKTIVKASAGAFEKMDIYWIEKEEQLIHCCREKDIPLYCAHRKDAISLYEMNFPESFVLALGGSFRGLSSLVCENSSQNIVIPYGNDFKNALDAPSAISVLSFEILRQSKWQ